ncbi:MAG TPA: SulP family inorganic anion transporter, partial [Aestuariivirga sp.]|nr:SulP family inorganic anion transporter [Aestuariivirga sp.]
MRNATSFERLLPMARWLRRYDRLTFARDVLGAFIVSFLFIPQSLAYALLAGLPVSAGLYASIVPLMGYALFGTSRFLAVGPVAVISLLTASALEPLAAAGTPEHAGLALTLALLSGLMLAGMGLFRLGFLANFLSHPVVSGFVTASVILIAASQMKGIFGIKTEGDTLLEILPELVRNLPTLHLPTTIVGIFSLALLVFMRKRAAPLLGAAGLNPSTAAMLSRMGPLLAAFITIVAVMVLGLEAKGVKVLGTLPSAIPTLTLPPLSTDTILKLALPAFLISIIGFVESISVAHTFAAKHRDLILPNNELVGLGAANILAAFCGAFPVSGGFSRSVVNYDSGVQTPIAAIFTGIGIAIVVAFLAPFIAHVPQAVLSAIIIVAVMSLADFSILRNTWAYSRADFAAAAVTIVVTLVEGVEVGILAGVLVSIAMLLYRASRPHMATVGLVPNTEHFRNVKRHEVITSDKVLSVRVDESLFFANARYLEEQLTGLAAQNRNIEHMVLI